MSPIPRQLAPPLVALGLVLACLLAYSPALSGQLLWDDDAHVITRPNLQTLQGLLHIWTRPGATQQYYPLVYTSFWIEAHLWGTSHTPGYHVLNVLLHASGAFLLWRVLLRLSVPGALLAAFLFALHPVHVESVAWISERKNVMSGLFYFATALAFFRLLPPDAERPPAVRWRSVLPVLLLFLAALFSKTVTATLPAAILLLIYWKRSGRADALTWRDLTPVAAAGLAGVLLYGLLRQWIVLASRHGDQPGFPLKLLAVAAALALLLPLIHRQRARIRWRWIGPILPLFVLGVGVGLITPWFEKHFVGAGGEHFGFSPADRLLIAGRAVGFYLGKLFWPAELIFIYPRWNIDDADPRQYLYPAAFLVAVVLLWRLRHRLTLAPLVALLFFAGTLFPALGFFDVYPFVFSFVADHFQYLASVGPLALFAASAALIARRASPPLDRLTPMPAVTLVIVLATLTWRQAHFYTDSPTLYTHILERNPDSWLAHNNIATHYNQRRRFDLALQHADQSLALRPDNDLAHNNRALALTGLHRYDDALAAYRDSIRRRHANRSVNRAYVELLEYLQCLPEAVNLYQELLEVHPDSAELHYALGHALDKSGRYAPAEARYRRAIELQPYIPEAHNDLALVLLRQGRVPEAMPFLRNAFKLRAHYPEAHKNMGVALLARGDVEGGLAELRQALAYDPDLPEAHYEIGLVLLSRQRFDLAAEHFATAVRAAPRFVEARVNLAAALYSAGHTRRAIEELRVVVAQRPDHASARRNLAVILEQLGHTAEAVTHYRAAVAARPDWAEALDRLAWLLATDPSPQVRHAADAVRLAMRAVELTGRANPRAHDTLAAAYAELGDMNAAVAAIDRAIELARQGHQDSLLPDLLRRQRLYLAGQPYHEPPRPRP